MFALKQWDGPLLTHRHQCARLEMLITSQDREGAHHEAYSTSQAERAGQSMNEISGAISSLSAIVAGISSASMEQSIGIEQVNKAVAQMDEVTQLNAALVEEAAAAAESLEEQSQQLQRQVSAFKLGNAAFATASSKNAMPGGGRIPKPRAELHAPSKEDAEWSVI